MINNTFFKKNIVYKYICKDIFYSVESEQFKNLLFIFFSIFYFFWYMIQLRTLINLLAFICFSLFTLPHVAAAADILVLQSADIKPYQEALEGFTSTCLQVPLRGGFKTVQTVTPEKLLLTGVDDASLLRQEIQRRPPELILAIGGRALHEAKQYRHIPILYLMTPGAGSTLIDRPGIAGVDMLISPLRQLEGFLLAIPSLKRLGIIHRTDCGDDFHAQAAAAIRQKGLTLITGQVSALPELPAALTAMTGKIDGLWLPPDSTLINRQSMEMLALYSMENHIPLLTFSENLLAYGAAVACSFNVFDMGAQAGEMAVKILADKPDGKLKPEPARKLQVRVNRKVALKLGITLNPDLPDLP